MAEPIFDIEVGISEIYALERKLEDAAARIGPAMEAGFDAFGAVVAERARDIAPRDADGIRSAASLAHGPLHKNTIHVATREFVDIVAPGYAEFVNGGEYIFDAFDDVKDKAMKAFGEAAMDELGLKGDTPKVQRERRRIASAEPVRFRDAIKRAAVESVVINVTWRLAKGNPWTQKRTAALKGVLKSKGLWFQSAISLGMARQGARRSGEFWQDWSPVRKAPLTERFKDAGVLRERPGATPPVGRGHWDRRYWQAKPEGSPVWRSDEAAFPRGWGSRRWRAGEWMRGYSTGAATGTVPEPMWAAVSATTGAATGFPGIGRGLFTGMLTAARRVSIGGGAHAARAARRHAGRVTGYDGPDWWKKPPSAPLPALLGSSPRLRSVPGQRKPSWWSGRERTARVNARRTRAEIAAERAHTGMRARSAKQNWRMRRTEAWNRALRSSPEMWAAVTLRRFVKGGGMSRGWRFQVGGRRLVDQFDPRPAMRRYQRSVLSRDHWDARRLARQSSQADKAKLGVRQIWERARLEGVWAANAYRSGGGWSGSTVRMLRPGRRRRVNRWTAGKGRGWRGTRRVGRGQWADETGGMFDRDRWAQLNLPLILPGKQWFSLHAGARRGARVGGWRRADREFGAPGPLAAFRNRFVLRLPTTAGVTRPYLRFGTVMPSTNRYGQQGKIAPRTVLVAGRGHEPLSSVWFPKGGRAERAFERAATRRFRIPGTDRRVSLADPDKLRRRLDRRHTPGVEMLPWAAKPNLLQRTREQIADRMPLEGLAAATRYGARGMETAQHLRYGRLREAVGVWDDANLIGDIGQAWRSVGGAYRSGVGAVQAANRAGMENLRGAYRSGAGQVRGAYGAVQARYAAEAGRVREAATDAWGRAVGPINQAREAAAAVASLPGRVRGAYRSGVEHFWAANRAGVENLRGAYRSGAGQVRGAYDKTMGRYHTEADRVRDAAMGAWGRAAGPVHQSVAAYRAVRSQAAAVYRGGWSGAARSAATGARRAATRLYRDETAPLREAVNVYTAAARGYRNAAASFARTARSSLSTAASGLWQAGRIQVRRAAVLGVAVGAQPAAALAARGVARGVAGYRRRRAWKRTIGHGNPYLMWPRAWKRAYSRKKMYINPDTWTDQKRPIAELRPGQVRRWRKRQNAKFVMDRMNEHTHYARNEAFFRDQRIGPPPPLWRRLFTGHTPLDEKYDPWNKSGPIHRWFRRNRAPARPPDVLMEKLGRSDIAPGDLTVHPAYRGLHWRDQAAWMPIEPELAEYPAGQRMMVRMENRFLGFTPAVREWQERTLAADPQPPIPEDFHGIGAAASWFWRARRRG